MKVNGVQSCLKNLYFWEEYTGVSIIVTLNTGDIVILCVAIVKFVLTSHNMTLGTSLVFFSTGIVILC